MKTTTFIFAFLLITVFLLAQTALDTSWAKIFVVTNTIEDIKCKESE